ncbi:MAG: endopeptidase La [Chloroflexi bacterium HGW-Chloroflexi-8]|nr:MAG: endopeptidase La [Chloroflexi bacterium HGW-Chloroflexi-8]
MEEDENGEFECMAIILRELVIFPKMVTPIFVTPGINQNSIAEAHYRFETIIALYVDEENTEENVTDFLPIATEVAVGRLLAMPDGNHSALLQGRRRVELIEILQQEPVLKVRVKVVKENDKVDRKSKALIRTSLDLFEKCVHLDRSLPEEAHLFAVNIQEPSWLSDMISSAISLPLNIRQKLLLCTDPKDRLKILNKILAQELDVLELEDEIQTKVQSEVDKSQREYYLREQLRAIQNELGETDMFVSEIVELRKKIEECGLSEEAKIVALKEADRLAQMSSLAPETAMVRSYLDWLLDLPWKNSTADNLDVIHANKVLEKNHYGLGKIKDRVLEYIAIQKLKPEDSKQPILCFVGAPGTGKTSLGKSIAEALGRKFVRVSLGGVRDEAEIRGHRRTYIGALPGRILQTMKKAGTINPLFMLDEIDKLGADFRGDPSAALLEVLDPEQNNEFSDHYLEVNYDLSKVMFITTANTLMTIPPALLDRMEVIEFSSYLEEEKIAIARQFLIPRQLHETGIKDLDILFTELAVKLLIHNYTYEAGVRNLEREIGRVCRKIARLKTEGKTFPRRIDEKVVERFLGPQEFFELEAESEDEIGVTTAMAWTENGGDIMPVEVLVMDGKGNLQITGQIGEIMQESAQAAMSFTKSRARSLQIDPDLFENVDVHIHIPEGAIPKDGPSAGITMACSIISAFTDRKVRRDIAMTGEITLRGRILPVGGIREKILAAHRAGITTIIIPKKNEKDLGELNKKVRSSLNIIGINHIEEILDIALLPAQEFSESKKISIKDRKKKE